MTAVANGLTEDMGFDEAAVLHRVRGGDRAAFGQLVEHTMRRAHRVALGLVGNMEDAKDLSQEAYVRAYRARDRLDPTRAFFPWYYQILRRLCLNFLRDRKTRRRHLEDASPWLVAQADARASGERPDQQSERAAIVRRLAAAIDALPDHEREVFTLREYEGLSYRDIAELVDIPKGTVMSRLYNARRRLATMLEDPR